MATVVDTVSRSMLLTQLDIPFERDLFLRTLTRELSGVLGRSSMCMKTHNVFGIIASFYTWTHHES